MLSSKINGLFYKQLQFQKTYKMDVKELMAFKPAQTPKRPAPQDPSKSVEDVDEDPNDSYEARAKKRKIARKKAQAVRNRIIMFSKF